MAIVYPDVENNWPGFFKETSLEYLTEKYKPTIEVMAEQAAYKKMMEEKEGVC